MPKNDSPNVPPAFKRWPGTKSSNLSQIEEIENLASSMLIRLAALDATEPEQSAAKYDAQEFLRLFQRNQIKTCRDMFE